MTMSSTPSRRENSTVHAVFSAQRIAQLMAETPEKAILPTPEQTAVIEQPIRGSVLVVAGAGSGKTETMANRVVWIVANGLAAPSQILGLTFTRKAAGELGERVAGRLVHFTERLSAAREQGALSPAESTRADELIELMAEGLDLPEVSTYNAFASAIVQEFGAYAGVAAGATVIDHSVAWGIARDVVCSSEESALAESSDSISVIVKQILTLDHAVADNLTSLDEVESRIAEAEMLAELPYNEKKSAGRYKKIDDILVNMQATRLAVRLARRFAEEKQRRGLIEFSDQLALAVETTRRSAEAVRTLRARTPIVLLDEVQDTSVGQTALLAALFQGNAVMAVGDPHQSIYGFRGASASNLQTFHRDFGAPGEDRESAHTLSLSTSWRNPSAVLAAANVVSAPLARALEAETTGISVKPLTSKAQYLGIPEQLTPVPLEHLMAETIADEFAALANWLRDARGEHLVRTGEQATAAVVFRGRRHMPAVSEALWAAGVPNRIVGLGGLLTTPEVTDLVSTLRCVWFADAGSELLRLLAGPRFRIGVADLGGLRRAAAWFSQRDHTKQKINDAELAATPQFSDPERSFTLLDTLDEIASMQKLDHNALKDISDVGRVRLREAGQMLRHLRQEVGGDIPSLLRSVIAALRLDIELDAGEHTGYEGSAVARANLDAFSELVEGFLLNDELGTLDSVLNWLERATEDDEAAEHVPEPEPGTVQLITAHGSKGLEWDLVVVPRLVEGEFPGASREGMGWLRAGQLPDTLRGDAHARPRLELALVDTQKAASDAVVLYQDALKDRHAAEERRLAYVAFTRAASRLLLTSSFWGGQKSVRLPSVYVQELADAGLITEIPEHSEFETDPAAGNERTLEWPLDPLGRRATVVHAAAESLQQAIDLAAPSPRVHPVVELLLAERSAERNHSVTEAAQQTEPAGRITASTFHEFITDPVDAKRRKLRPMPMQPYRRTRTGNLFHEWVERRATTQVGTSLMLSGFDVDSFDELETEEPFADDLQALIDQFERSRWASLQPVAVELEVTLPFAGQTLVCKLDAIYCDNSGEVPRYEIVDWKSGRPPKNDAERAVRFLQLDLYRHAYARWTGIDPEQVEVTLFYVADGQELQSANKRSFEELEELWLSAATSNSAAL